MGSLLNNSKKTGKHQKRGYSFAKQKDWHYVGDGSSRPAPSKRGHGEIIDPSNYGFFNPANLVIP